jgi:hypothetical protein
MGDGVFHLLVVRKPVSRARLLDLFLQIEAGKHIDCDTVRPFSSNEGGKVHDCSCIMPFEHKLFITEHHQRQVQARPT